MADTKITALTALTGADPANDVIPIVDVSDTTMAASGTTKKISVNNILGASGTATLASATITGNLTLSAGTVNGVGYLNASKVLTAGSALIFDGTNLGVGGTGQLRFATSGGAIGDNSIGTENSFSMMLRCGRGSTSNIELASDKLVFGTAGSERYRIASDGVATWSNVGGVAGTAMTLNSTGLGVGVTPTNYGATFRTLAVNATDAGILDLMSNSVSQFRIFGNGLENRLGGITNVPMTFHTNNTERARIDASGNLLVGKTATGVGTVGNEIKAVGEFYSTQSASTDANFTYHVYSTGAAAYRFYVGLGGTVYATNTTISAISDARLKENVQDIDVGLDAILALKPRKFDWKNGKGKNIKGDRGFIAQEFETVFPNLVDEWKDPAPEGEAPYKSVRQDLIPVLVKAIQELTARVQTLETR